MSARRPRFLLLLLLAVGGMSGCWSRSTRTMTEPQRLTQDVRQILSREDPSPRFYRERSRLENMGVELDAVLVSLIDSRGASNAVRSNALLLLADRRSPAALGVLRRVLLTSDEDFLRSTAIFGLQKLVTGSPEAASAIRAAIADPSRRVRLGVLQALDVEDVALIRGLLTRERDRSVRLVATDLVELAESRGAPLGQSVDGSYRTTVQEGKPQIVFQPTWRDTLGQVEVGSLWIETPRARLLPLSQRVEVVGGVVPAFLSPDRKWVVFETDREIWLRNLASGATRVVGRGIAPRPIPFTDDFVYLEEDVAARVERSDGATALTYHVLRAAFAAGVAERLGSVQAVARAERYAHASPARWIAVGESPEGFVLRGEAISTFLLPNPFPAAPAPASRRTPP